MKAETKEFLLYQGCVFWASLCLFRSTYDLGLALFAWMVLYTAVAAWWTSRWRKPPGEAPKPVDQTVHKIDQQAFENCRRKLAEANTRIVEFESIKTDLMLQIKKLKNPEGKE